MTVISPSSLQVSKSTPFVKARESGSQIEMMVSDGDSSSIQDTEMRVFESYGEAIPLITSFYSNGYVPDIHINGNGGVDLTGLDLSPVATRFGKETTEADLLSWAQDCCKPGEFRTVTFPTYNDETQEFTPLERARLGLVEAAYVKEGYISREDSAADAYTENGLQMPLLVVGKNHSGESVIWGGFRLISPHSEKITSHGVVVPGMRLPAHSLVSANFIGPNGEVLTGVIPRSTPVFIEISQMVTNHTVDQDKLPIKEMITDFCLRHVLHAYSEARSKNGLPPMDLKAVISASPSYIEKVNLAKVGNAFKIPLLAIGRLKPENRKLILNKIGAAFQKISKRGITEKDLGLMITMLKKAPATVKFFSSVEQPWGKKRVIQRGSIEEFFVLKLA